MKQAIIKISIICAILFLLSSIDFSHAIILFLLAGVIPGTNIVVSPVEAMAAGATTLTIAVIYITSWPSIRRLFLNKIRLRAKAKIAVKKAVAKKRKPPRSAAR